MLVQVGGDRSGRGSPAAGEPRAQRPRSPARRCRGCCCACTRTSSTRGPGGSVSSSRRAWPAQSRVPSRSPASIVSCARLLRAIASSGVPRPASVSQAAMAYVCRVGAVAGEPAEPRQPALGVADLVDVTHVDPDGQCLAAGVERLGDATGDVLLVRQGGQQPGAVLGGGAVAVPEHAFVLLDGLLVRPERRGAAGGHERVPGGLVAEPGRLGVVRTCEPGRPPVSASSASRIRRWRAILRSCGTSSTTDSRASSWRNISASPWSWSTPAPSASSSPASLPGATAATRESSARGPASATTSRPSRASSVSRAVRDSTASCTLRGTALPPAAITSVT